jgi:hypothetical protein
MSDNNARPETSEEYEILSDKGSERPAVAIKMHDRCTLKVDIVHVSPISGQENHNTDQNHSKCRAKAHIRTAVIQIN